ncbi:MAG: inositol monophosphatase family protein [Desulfobacteraceae bacterium]|jgi:myo-inositol-1(or 4)-monophosphatase
MWEPEVTAAREAARLAGDELIRMVGHTNRITKKGEIDLVTEADFRSERALVDFLSKRFAGDGILSEESEGQTGRSGRTWILDPLDGTINYAHGFPFYAVSIALEAEGNIVVGLVSNPVSGEVFEAVRGEGASLCGERLQVSQTEVLNDALLGTGFPYTIRREPDPVLRRFRDLILRARGVRRAGSAALDLCFVAAGRLDGFWEQNLNPWDTAAGILLVQEAGGLVTTFQGAPYRPRKDRTVAAANPVLHQALIDVLYRGEKASAP